MGQDRLHILNFVELLKMVGVPAKVGKSSRDWRRDGGH